MQSQQEQQHARSAPRGATPASNPTTNPERTNNPRDPLPPRRTRSSVDLASYTARAGGQTPASTTAARTNSPTRENQEKDKTRLNQIISHFHTKIALTICSSRATLPQVKLQTGEIKQDRWFNLMIDETDILQNDLYDWKRLDQSEEPAPPLIVEIYLDTANLNSSQALVLIDDTGKRWDVGDALASSAPSSPRPSRHAAKYCEVVLERWTVQLGDPGDYSPEQLNDLLPNVYKKGVVFFRSLYTFLHFTPAWKLYRKLSRQPGSHQAMRMKFRIRRGQVSARTRDSLYTPLCGQEHRNGDFVARHDFPPVLTPPGPLTCSLEYRQNCSFTVADAESLLSSRFLGLEEGIPTIPAGRSLPSSHTDQARERYSRTVAAGSTTGAKAAPRGLLGAYGSLGTFHGTDNKTGSPVRELRQRAEQADEEEAAEEASRAQARMAEQSNSRRISISLRDNPPFKAGSLASSPRPSPRPLPSPSLSGGRLDSSFPKNTSGTPPHDRLVRIPSSSRTQQLRASPSIPNETAVASSGSTSPKPAPVRYSSSFANRHKRLASQGSKTADSNASSARGSSSSKEKSGQLYEGMAADASSGKSDDDDIAAFISQIETAKDIKSFRTSSPKQASNTAGSSSSAGASASNPEREQQAHQVVNLSKYTSIRDTNTALAEEMGSSSLIQTSSTPPSRRMSNVPGLSTSSSSPSRALPHIPHVRSRLSTHSVVEEPIPNASLGSRDGLAGQLEVDGEDDEPFIFQHDNV